MNNNNNFISELDNSNNSSTSDLTVSTNINNMNSASTPSHLDSIQTQNNLSDEQFNNQNNGNFFLNSNVSESNYFVNTIENSNVSQQEANKIDDKANNDELLRAFIGNNYDKITTKPFNFAGFFFTTFYLFYRKMFLYGILLFIINLIVLNVINSFIVNIIVGIIVGFLVNKLYIYFANKKIAKIKSQNEGKDLNQLKNICSARGETSVGKVFLGVLAEIAIILGALIVMMIAGISYMVGDLFKFENWNIIINGNDINNEDTNDFSSIKDATLVEDVVVNGYSCFDSKCSVSIEKSGKYIDYVFSANNIDLFKLLSEYSDYVKINIYYTKKGSEKTIVDYKLYLKSNDNEITSVKNENELRSKIGLYSLGTHTETFSLTAVGTKSFGFKNNKSYTYIDYTLIDSKNNEYKMKYIIPDGKNDLNLIENNTYTVTFEVVEDTLGYEFYIKSIN